MRSPEARKAGQSDFRERLQKVARGEANWTELRETLSELAVADFYGRRKDGSTMPAGSVTAGLDAMAQKATNPEDVAALGKFRSVLRGIRTYFRAVFGTVAALKGARRAGAAADFDALIDKVTGRGEQPEQTANLPGHDLGGLAFSLRAADEKPSVDEVLKQAKLPGDSRAWTELPLSEQEKQRLASATGTDLTGFRRVADVNALRHIEKRHGVSSNDPYPVTETDLGKLPQIVNAPGVTDLAPKRNEQNQKLLSVKYLDGWYYYVEEVRTGAKALALLSLRKTPAQAASAEAGPYTSETFLHEAQQRLERATTDYKSKNFSLSDRGASGESPDQAVTPEEATRLAGLIKGQLAEVGEHQPPRITIIRHAGEIPDELRGNPSGWVRLGEQSVPETYYVRDMNGAPHMVALLNGATEIAQRRGITLEQRLQQLGLHEIVHHYASLDKLFPPEAKPSYNRIVDGLLARLSSAKQGDPELLKLLTRPVEEGGYGYDPKDRGDRAKMAEEYLARLNERFQGAPPTWLARAWSKIRELVRQIYPKLAWSDAEIRTLIDGARRRAASEINPAGQGIAPRPISSDAGTTEEALDPVTGARDTSARTAAPERGGSAGDVAATGLAEADRGSGPGAGGGGVEPKAPREISRNTGLGIQRALYGSLPPDSDLSSARIRASQLLTTPPANEPELSPGDRQTLTDLRAHIPYISRDHLLGQIDASALAGWLRGREGESYGDHRETQALQEQMRTLERLYPETRGKGLEGLLSHLDARGAAQAEAPGRLRVIGVGGEGAVFTDVGGHGAYKIHPGDVAETAQGIRDVRPGQEADATHAELGRVPLIETIQRYLRQNLLPGSAETHIAGVTENGLLVTRQPTLDARNRVTDGEITAMMRKMGGQPISVEGRGREVRNSWAVPDGAGNWLMAIDLKADNVLRNRAGNARLTDGILTPITPEVLARNPQLREFDAGRPDLQFSKQPAESLKRRQDKPTSWNEVKPGHSWDSAKKFLPPTGESRLGFFKRGSWQQLVKRIGSWLSSMGEAEDPWGGTVRFDNPQARGNFSDPLENRAAHLIGTDQGNENRVLNAEKLDWLGSTRRTIEDAQARVRQGNETLYFRNYKEGTHMVVTEDGVVKDQRGLVTQYAPEPNERFEGAIVEKVRRGSGLAARGSLGADEIPAQPKDQTDQTPTHGAQRESGSKVTVAQEEAVPPKSVGAEGGMSSARDPRRENSGNEERGTQAYVSPREVRAAYRAGDLDHDEAAEILRRQFAFA